MEEEYIASGGRERPAGETNRGVAMQSTEHGAPAARSARRPPLRFFYPPNAQGAHNTWTNT